MISARLMAVVHERDNFTCRFCGFRCTQYQQVVVDGEDWRDLDQVVTACIHCQQCLSLDLVTEQKSGFVIHFPDATQAEINRVLPELFVAAMAEGDYFERAKPTLEMLLSRRAQAAELIGSHDAGPLAKQLRGCRTEEERSALRSKLADIRLLAANRRITFGGKISYNQFPLILAAWRATFGPGRTPEAGSLPALDRFLSLSAISSRAVAIKPAER